MRLHRKLEDQASAQPRAGRVRKGSEEFFRTDYLVYNCHFAHFRIKPHHTSPVIVV